MCKVGCVQGEDAPRRSAEKKVYRKVVNKTCGEEGLHERISVGKEMSGEGDVPGIMCVRKEVCGGGRGQIRNEY